MSDFKKAQRNQVSLDQVIRTLDALDLGVTNRLWIAFSGGVDSTVLLHAASKAYEPHQLAVVHVNHRLSPNADSWELHCKNVATRLGLEFHSERVSLHGKNLEYEGRQARLSVFKAVLRDGDVLATAHHRDDELESLAWQLATGRALVGISDWRQFEQGRLWRPLLQYNRNELLSLANEYAWSWIEDESNQDVAFTRNALRHQVLPQLKSAFSDFESQLLGLKEPPLEHLPRAPIKANVMCEDSKKTRAWLHAFGITPRNSIVQEIMRQASARKDAKVLVRVSSRSSVRRHKGLFFVVADAEPISDLPVRVGEDALYTFGELTWVQRDVGLPIDAQLHAGSRQGGESLNIKNRNVKLSKWFYDQGVPPWERDAWPLLYQDERLIAVPGLGIDSSACSAHGYLPNWRRTTQYS